MQEPAVQIGIPVTSSKRECLVCNTKFSEATMHLLSNAAGEVNGALCIECHQGGVLWAAKQAQEEVLALRRAKKGPFADTRDETLRQIGRNLCVPVDMVSSASDAG